MVGLYLLQGAGGEPMAGHVDDVIGARHDVQEALLVDVAGVHGVVEALRGGTHGVLSCNSFPFFLVIHSLCSSAAVSSMFKLNIYLNKV